MNKNNSTVRGNKWNVSTQFPASADDSRTELHVFRFVGNKLVKAECYGMRFANSDEAYTYAEEHGFLHRWSRNTTTFHSNRCFRRRSGKDAMNVDRSWQTKMKLGKHMAEKHLTV